MNRSGWRILRGAMLLAVAAPLASLPQAPAHAEIARVVAVEYSAQASSVAETSEECGLTFLARIETQNSEQFAVVGYIGAYYVRDKVPGVAIKIQATRLQGDKTEPVELSNAEVKFSGGDTSAFKQIPGEGANIRLLMLTDFARAQEWLLIVFAAFKGFSVVLSGPKLDATFDLPSVRLRGSEPHTKFMDCQYAASNKFGEWVKAAKAKK